MATHHIRPMIPADFDAAAHIYNQHIGTGNSTMDTISKDATYFHNLIEKFGDREGIWTLEVENQVAGFGLIKSYSDRPGYRLTAETSTYLAREQMRKGWGGKIQQFILDQAKALNYHHLVAKILAHNFHSIAFHEKFGYEKVGIQKEIGNLNGEWKDVMIMQKLFREKD